MNTNLTYQDLLNAGDSLGIYATNMETLLNAIKTNIDKIGTEGIWSGTAAENAKAKFNEIALKFDEFHEAITSCKNYLNKVVENYQAADQAANNAINF